MGKYGEAAVMAVSIIREESASPVDAWKKAMQDIFPNNVSSRNKARDKNCPRSAFLGLCEEGKIKGVPAGSYTRSKFNKEYALKALKILQDNPELKPNPNMLWGMVLDGSEKVHNSQMEVVISLFESKLTI